MLFIRRVNVNVPPGCSDQLLLIRSTLDDCFFFLVDGVEVTQEVGWRLVYEGTWGTFKGSTTAVVGLDYYIGGFIPPACRAFWQGR